MGFKPADDPQRGAVHCGVCGKVIRPGEQTARVDFKLCHAECAESVEDADYADYVNGVPS